MSTELPPGLGDLLDRLVGAHGVANQFVGRGCSGSNSWATGLVGVVARPSGLKVLQIRPEIDFICNFLHNQADKKLFQ